MTQPNPPRTTGFVPPPMPAMSAAVPGMPMTASMADDLVGDVTIDTPCRKCSYNLRGLKLAGRCPECGTPVGTSVRGDLLRFSDPGWLETLRRGVNLILAGVVAVIVALILGVMARSIGQVPSIAVSLASSVLFILGGWLLTEPDPSGLGEDRYGTVRKIIRIGLIVSAVSTLLNITMQMMTFPPALRVTLSSLVLLAGLFGVVAQWAQLRYLSRLAQRIPDPKLVRRADFLTWAIGISYGLLVVFGGLVALIVGISGGPPGGGGPLVAIGCFLSIVGLALVVFGIMYLLMLERFGKTFKEQAALARQVWSSAIA